MQDEGIGAEMSSIDLRVTSEPVHWDRNLLEKINKLKKDEDDKPCFTAPKLFRGIPTPSSMGILRLSVLGRKWYGRTGVDGLGD